MAHYAEIANVDDTTTKHEMFSLLKLKRMMQASLSFDPFNYLTMPLVIKILDAETMWGYAWW
jgi:hypothetical protein